MAGSKEDWSDGLLALAGLGAYGTWIALVASYFITKFNGVGETACEVDPYSPVECPRLPNPYNLALILGVVTLVVGLAGVVLRLVSTPRTPPQPPAGAPPRPTASTPSPPPPGVPELAPLGSIPGPIEPAPADGQSRPLFRHATESRVLFLIGSVLVPIGIAIWGPKS